MYATFFPCSRLLSAAERQFLPAKTHDNLGKGNDYEKIFARACAGCCHYDQLCAAAGCSQTASDKTAQQVYDAIQSAFKENYGVEAIPNSPVEVDDTTLEQKFYLAPDDVESYAGAVAGMMTNCDELVVVQAKKGEVENVREALEKALQDQKDAFGFYPVMNNTERLDAAKVVTQGDYAALLIVGISPEDPDAAVDFTDDVSLAEEAFYNALK